MNNFDAAKQYCCQMKVYERLLGMAADPTPEVRAAFVYAMSKFVGNDETLYIWRYGIVCSCDVCSIVIDDSGVLPNKLL